MKECCEYFFKANDLQNILNTPLTHCGYCGRRLSSEEFERVLKRGPVKKYQGVILEKILGRNTLRIYTHS